MDLSLPPSENAQTNVSDTNPEEETAVTAPKYMIICPLDPFANLCLSLIFLELPFYFFF